MSFISPRNDVPCARYMERDRGLRYMRHALIEFGESLGLFHDSICGCGQPDCRYPESSRFVQVAPVEEMLHAILSEWDPGTHAHQEEADPDGESAAMLREALLAFAETFELLACQCVRQPCRHSDVESLTALELLELVDEEWHGRAGCYQHMATEGEVLHIRKQQRTNLQLIQAFSERLDAFPEAVTVSRCARETLWYWEARHLAMHSLDTWMPRMAEDRVTRKFLQMAHAIALETGWEEPDLSHWVLAARDAYTGLLVYHIADPTVTEGLYEPFQRSIPLNEILALVHA